MSLENEDDDDDEDEDEDEDDDDDDEDEDEDDDEDDEDEDEEDDVLLVSVFSLSSLGSLLSSQRGSSGSSSLIESPSS